jgi:hypothetical protein
VGMTATQASAWLPTACAALPMSSSLVGSLLHGSLAMNMACRRSLTGVALRIDAVDIGKLAVVGGPRRMILGVRACGGNLFSGCARQEAGTQWQSRDGSAGSYDSRAPGVCSATTSAQGVSAKKVTAPLTQFDLIILIFFVV